MPVNGEAGAGVEGSAAQMTLSHQFDPSAFGGMPNMPMEMWGAMPAGYMHHLPNVPFQHGGHMSDIAGGVNLHMPMGMYGMHHLMHAQMQQQLNHNRAHGAAPPLDDDGKGKKGRGKNKAAKGRASDEVRPVMPAAAARCCLDRLRCLCDVVPVGR